MDFQVDPDMVVEDQGVGPRLQRSFSGADSDAGRITTAQEIQSAISDTTVEALRKAGLPAERVPPGTIYRPGDLLLAGQVSRIDEGNRTRRLGIGFGAGMSVVQADASLFAVLPNRPPVLLQTYQGKADSGRRPGLGAGAAGAVAQSNAALGALSGVSNVSGEARRSPVGREAASLGRRLAHDIGQLAADRAWIQAAAIPPWVW